VTSAAALRKVLRPKSRSVQFQACCAPYVRRFNRRESEDRVRADNAYAACSTALECDVEFKIDAGIRRVAKVIHAADVDHKNLLRVEPVARPRGGESEPVATVLEAVIVVIALGNSKRVFASKVGLVAIGRNAAGILRRLCVLLLRILFFLLVVLLRVFLFGLSVLLLLRALLILLGGFLRFRLFLVLCRLCFLFFLFFLLFLFMLLLCVVWSR